MHYITHSSLPIFVRYFTDVKMNAIFLNTTLSLPFTVRKVSKCGVFSGPYFPLSVLNREIYGRKSPYWVRIQENTEGQMFFTWFRRVSRINSCNIVKSWTNSKPNLFRLIFVRTTVSRYPKGSWAKIFPLSKSCFWLLLHPQL